MFRSLLSYIFFVNFWFRMYCIYTPVGDGRRPSAVTDKFTKNFLTSILARHKLSLFQLNIFTFFVLLHFLHTRQLISGFLLLIWSYSILRPFVPNPRQRARWWYLLWLAWACPLEVDPFLMKLASNTNFRPFYSSLPSPQCTG